jgi:hypothetical protein
MPSSPKDQRHYEPRSAKELMVEFPQWEVYRGVNQLWYARYGAELLRGEDLQDLRDEIIKWTRYHDSERII